MACAVINLATGAILNLIVADCTTARVQGALVRPIPPSMNVDQQWVWQSNAFQRPRHYAVIRSGKVIELIRIPITNPTVPTSPGATVIQTNDDRIGPDWTWTSQGGFKPPELRQ